MNTRTQEKALEALALWLTDRLPEQIDVIVASGGGASHGYVYIDVSPKVDMVYHNPEPPASYNRPQIARVELFPWYSDWTNKLVWIGWRDNPATLVVVTPIKTENSGTLTAP